MPIILYSKKYTFANIEKNSTSMFKKVSKSLLEYSQRGLDFVEHGSYNNSKVI